MFGLSAWIRSVADRLAAHGHPALALPLFSSMALDLELAYAAFHPAEGRRHKYAITAHQILGDVSAVPSWLRARYPQVFIHLVGFCFGVACRFSEVHVARG